MTRARTYSPLIRYPATALAYAVGIPAFKILQWSGLLYPALVRLERKMRQRMGTFEGYQPQPSDIFVCTWFKSGTNWMLQLCTQAAFRGEAEFEHIHDLVAWPDTPFPYMAIPLDDETPARRALTGKRVIKTHLNAPEVPLAPEARYLCLIRDPKDVFVSAYHFIRSAFLGPIALPVSVALDAYLSADFIHGLWSDHVDGWWRLRHLPNLLFLTFDEVKKDLPGTVERVAGLLDVDLTPAQCELVTRKASFDYMKTIDDKFSPGMVVPWTKGVMVRSGKSKSSGELLTVQQQERIDSFFRAELQRIGSDFPYDEHFLR